MSKKEAMEYYGTTPSGLSSEEANLRLSKYGSNELIEGKRTTVFQIFISQFKDILVWTLIGAAIVSAIIGAKEGDFIDTILIAIILIINAMVGTYQEWRADKAIDALKMMVSHLSHVVRNDEELEISSKNLVPGDIVVVKQGDRVPADLRLIESINLRTEEAQLTGESEDVQKSTYAKIPSHSTLGDQINLLFMGTHVVSGKGKAVVVRTGMQTEMGKIAEDVQEIQKDPTPTQIKLDEFSVRLSYVILGMMALMVLWGVLVASYHFDVILLIAVTLAVAAIPEGLVIVVTLALALGVQRMARKNAIVKKLPAVESLGSVTTICTDKTGTLTLNKMTVQKIVTFNPHSEHHFTIFAPKDLDSKRLEQKNIKMLCDGAALCNNSVLDDHREFGNPTELALLRAVDEVDIDRNVLSSKYERIDEIPFDSERKRMTIMVADGETKISFTKGAPDVLLEMANSVDLGDGSVPLTAAIREDIQHEIDILANDALRVLAFGYFELKASSYNIYEFEKNLVLTGLMGMIDPPKPGVQKAVADCKTAGINVIMVTGDHKNTALAIGKEIGIADENDEVINGIQLDAMSDEDLQEHIGKISVFARISPSHKLRIVRALKNQGEIVAMTGDGVNDAPALKGADIGIAMGSGTDVTKETSEMILEDDNFTTIVSAVREGRGIYDKILKFIKYMLASNTAEIIVIFLGIVLGFPSPLIPVQILWVNLVTDGVPAIALGVDPTSDDIMDRQPRNTKENLLAKSRLNYIFIIGSWLSFVTLGSFFLFFKTNIFGTIGDLNKARTVAFTILALSQFVHALAARESTQSILNKNALKNKVLLYTIIISIFLQVVLVQGDAIIVAISGGEFNFLHTLFETVPFTAFEWFWVSVCSLSLLAFSEIMKFIVRNTKFKDIF